MLEPSLNLLFQFHLALIEGQPLYFTSLILYKSIIRGKDILDYMSHQEVIYKISCHDCDATYVG